MAMTRTMADVLHSYSLPGRAADARVGITQAQAGERLGLNGIFLSERWGTKELGALMGALTQATQRVQLVAGMTHFGTRHPLVQAGMAATLQTLSSGRFVLGFGRAMPALLRKLGIPVLNNARMADYVDISVPAERLVTRQAFEPATVGSNASIVRQVYWWRRVGEEDRPEDLPLVNVAARWLLDHAPALDHVSVVHGDFRAGNFLFLEATAQVTAWLDWELAVLGDRHQDLAWASAPHFGHFAKDGTSFLASGLLPTAEFLARYVQSSGLRVDAERLRYFRIFNDFTTTVHMLATAWRVARYGKTHQDVLVAWLAMIGHLALAQLRNKLAEVLQ